MNNNDILLRLRYALDIKDTEIIKAFQLGGIDISREEEKAMLTKINNQEGEVSDSFEKNLYVKMINNKALDTFLNGFIIVKRGEPKNKATQSIQTENTEIRHINNILLKKIKIALALTSEDMLDILAAAGVYPSKGELGAILRKEGHRNFKPCGDKYARNFLKGLALCYRE
ncbi:DUF1456 family protein [Enterococcus dongliensis]|uniref:DUF1456 family protein n=1 Tax=Enterococcus dongliensis TaxID=2559925 RepID=A0AAW8TKX2_9ENTE|nr:DUF1456 family protein [Enterococcus dongliensis]MDT2596913.1 DUF1456 family protein [Enterococcus dongliensis]MDT2634685.1 DUF1456 family protein [Enterococcus dongliensis]MDT2637737.1 DUF1456 family protein [Enterococcus dongliensis]MDT2642822.1 DUF1456 family protein [Enterococcus dongliensis]MDT2647915.1 DUF1456 family protein [Enterococcus dongliensis]